MTYIVQPATVTDMRRDPKSLLERVKKEKVVPVLTHSEFDVAMIDINELNRLHEMIKDLKHELFVQETLEAERDMERGKVAGSFNSIEALEKHFETIIEANEDCHKNQ